MIADNPKMVTRFLNGTTKHIRVLMYHQIVDDPREARDSWTCVEVRKFRRHLELLDRWGFTTITLDDFRLHTEGKLNLPKKPVIITFDDGYVDTYSKAFPLLRDFGMRAVIFVIGDRKIKKNTWDLGSSLRVALLMDAQQIRELHKAGMEIGAHSMTHRSLTDLVEQDVWNELIRSKMLLEILLDAPVGSFSYPFGMVNEKVKRLVGDAGYTFGCGVFSGPPIFGQEYYEIRRLTITNDTDLLGMSARMLGPYPRYDWLRWKAGRRIERIKGNLLGEQRGTSITSTAGARSIFQKVRG